MLTADKLTDLCCDGLRPTVEEIAEHFEGTIFWNWAESVAKGLDDDNRIQVELPLAVYESSNDEGYISRRLRFECGECSIDVGSVYEGPNDETATETDAHFVANLPVYVPALFRKIRELQQTIDNIRGLTSK